MSDRTQLELSRRKVRDRSVVLLFVGIVLLLPPVGAMSLIDGRIAGIPLPIVYIFAVWIVLIGGCAAMSRGLRDELDADPDEQPVETDA